MEETTPSDGTEIYTTLVDLFGKQHDLEIRKAILLSRTNTDKESQMEAAVDMVFELISQPREEEPKTPPKKPSRANSVETGAIKKTYATTTNDATMFWTPSEATSSQKQSTLLDEIETPSAKFLPPEYKVAIDLISQGYKVMIIMRGLPGSGKSYLANQIIKRFGFEPRNHIFSADDYFYDVNGRYAYDVNRIGEAHDYNQNRVLKKVRDYWSPLIVDNTNMKIWEMFPYVRMAVQYKYRLIILEPATPWAHTPRTLGDKNKHHVPKDKIRKMMDNYERTDVVKLLEILKLDHHLSSPLEFRHYPAFTKKFLEENKQAFPEISTDSEAVKRWVEPMEQEPSKSLEINEAAAGPKPQRNLFETQEVSDWQPPPDNLMDTIDWQAHEKDGFWEKYDKAESVAVPKPKTESAEPKPKRDETFSLLDSLQKLAREEREKFKMETEEKERLAREAVPSLIREQEELKDELVKHKRNCNNENKAFREIRQMFPSIRLTYLWDLFVQCNGDGDWTTDILLNDCNKENYEVPESALDDFDCNCGKKPNQTVPSKPKVLPAPGTTLHLTEVKEKRPKKNHQQEQVESDQLKKMIEESFVISDSHYSNHTRKIRNMRHGPPKPSMTEESDMVDTEEWEELQMGDSDQDDVVEIDLGVAFVSQLESLFGGNVFKVENNTLVLGDLKLKTNIFLTKSLGQQLYALWCESLYHQLEEQKQQCVRDDLELARQLDAKEKYPGLFKEQEANTIQDVIEIETALAAYKEDISKWKDELPNTIAYNLARDKLFALFPNMDQEYLVEILAAHRNNLDETINVLKNTLQNPNEKEFENRSKELFAQAQQEIDELSEGYQEFERDDKKLSPEETKRAALKEFEESRNIAQHHSQLKAECYTKARNAIGRNEHAVALYYSQIADLHKTKIDFFNQKAANCLMEAHNVNQNNENMLDLHFLHSSEALQCLDLFLDKHIRKLMNTHKNYKHIYVITGRGKNSINGIPTIKIRVKARLRERNLKFSEVNPGLLKVKVFQNSKFA